MRRLMPRLLLVISLLLAACGPTVPLQIAIRQALVDVFYGSPHKAAVATAPVPLYQPPPPLNFTYPIPSSYPVATAAPCAALAELAVPRDPATSYVSGPPPKGSYSMRSKGTVTAGSIKNQPLPPQLSLIRPDRPLPGTDQVDGSYSDYALVTGYSATVYTEFDFRLAPDNAATPGILLTGLKWRDPVRGSLDFVPQQPMQFLQTPVAVNQSWEAAGWDPIDQASVELQASIPKKDTVDACGVPLDAHQLAISGNVVTPSLVLTWTASYDIGTQFGGLILAEDVQLSNVGSTTYSYDETSIINTKPALPAP